MPDTSKTIIIGPADGRFKKRIMIPSYILIIIFVIWTFLVQENPIIGFANFLIIYAVIFFLYFTRGIWLHDILHATFYKWPFNKQKNIVQYTHKFLWGKHGYYTVEGPIEYPVLRRALLGPLYLVGGLFVLALFGLGVMPSWWFPSVMTMTVISVVDMMHDFYWIFRISKIGNKAVYFDHGSDLEVVWKG